jgi:O-antigen ligase
MTAGRGTAVSLAIAFTVVFATFPSIRRYWVRWQCAGILLGGLIYLLVFASFELKISPESEFSQSNYDAQSQYFENSLGRPMLHTSGRSWMWYAALLDVQKYPALGIGPYNYSCTRLYWFGHPHSFPIQFGAEWGLVALVIVLSVVFWILLFMTRKIRSSIRIVNDNSAINVLLLTSVFAALIHACLSGVLIMPASQMAGTLVCGGLLGSLAFSKEDPKPKRAPFWIAMPALLLSFYLVFIGIVELQTMNDRSEKLPPHIIAPRMWQDAKVCTIYAPTNLVTD